MKKKILTFVAIVAVSMILPACSNMHMTGGVGLNFHGGPYGMSVSPSINVGMYGGGYRW